MTLRRMGAYIIDYLLIIFFLAALLQIRFLHPNYEEYMNRSADVQDLLDKAVAEQDVYYMSKEEYIDASYELQKSSIVPSILTIVVYLAYYVGFALWNKGQTLGKKMFRIKIVDEDESNLKWYQLLLREVVLYNVIFQILLLILLVGASKGVYLKVSSILSLITNGIFIISVVMLILRKDKKTIHDFLAKTKVISE